MKSFMDLCSRESRVGSPSGKRSAHPEGKGRGAEPLGSSSPLRLPPPLPPYVPPSLSLPLSFLLLLILSFFFLSFSFLLPSFLAPPFLPLSLSLAAAKPRDGETAPAIPERDKSCLLFNSALKDHQSPAKQVPACSALTSLNPLTAPLAAHITDPPPLVISKVRLALVKGAVSDHQLSQQTQHLLGLCWQHAGVAERSWI